VAFQKTDSQATEPSLSDSTTTNDPSRVTSASEAPARDNGVRRALRYVGHHPFRTIAAATLAGALINANVAVSLGVVASAMVLLLNPNGREKRRRFERQLRRLGRGAVTVVREPSPSDRGRPSDGGALSP
jgi:hypothetical protein